jgi:hypothetical protein
VVAPAAGVVALELEPSGAAGACVMGGLIALLVALLMHGGGHGPAPRPRHYRGPVLVSCRSAGAVSTHPAGCSVRPYGGVR